MLEKQFYHNNLITKVTEDLPVEGYMRESIVTWVSTAEEVVRPIKLVALLKLVSLSNKRVGG